MTNWRVVPTRTGIGPRCKFMIPLSVLRCFKGNQCFLGPEAILDRGHFSPDRFLLAVEVVGNSAGTDHTGPDAIRGRGIRYIEDGER